MHARQLPRDLMPFACVVCDKKYSNRRDLRYHMQRFHNIVFGPWECAICHEKFNEYKQFSKHRHKLKHYKAPHEKQWKCIVHVSCAQTFPTREQRDDS